MARRSEGLAIWWPQVRPKGVPFLWASKEKYGAAGNKYFFALHKIILTDLPNLLLGQYSNMAPHMKISLQRCTTKCNGVPDHFVKKPGLAVDLRRQMRPGFLRLRARRTACIASAADTACAPAGVCDRRENTYKFTPVIAGLVAVIPKPAHCIIIILAALQCGSLHAGGSDLPPPPLEMGALKQALSLARAPAGDHEGWPRTVAYRHTTYDYRNNTFSEEKKLYRIEKKPLRIIPHSVGVTEILWAICPRERIIACNEAATDPQSCFIADRIREQKNIFSSRQTERVIGYRPDLVFTVFYSSAAFKEKLCQARIPFFDIGYFGPIDTIRDQALLIGRILGEEGNAAALVKTIDQKVAELRSRLPESTVPARVLYYDEGGYIPGRVSNFTSICELVRAVNVGAEQGIASWAQIDFERLLKWDPDIIVVPGDSGLKQLLMNTKILKYARAVKNRRIYNVPPAYLRASSQYVLLTANLLAGIVYENSFKDSP